MMATERPTPDNQAGVSQASDMPAQSGDTAPADADETEAEAHEIERSEAEAANDSTACD
jgi:hypothetical protein